VPELVERCVQLELRAKRIFERLARRFSERPEVEQFFQSLAIQEQEHADLLRFCRAAAGRGRWVERHLDPWQDVIPQLEERMKEAEFSSDPLTSLTDALQLVIEIESSEVNQTFRGVVEAADSDFVRRLRTFQEAISKHLTYICQGIKTLEPTLEAECDEMLAAYQAGPLQGNASTASSARRPFGDQRA